MKLSHRIVSAGLAVSLLAGCSLLGFGEEVAPPPIISSTATFTPTILESTLIAPDVTIYPSDTPGPTLPDDAILITEPGPLSEITSPVHIAGFADPTFEQNLVISIYDVDGNEIIRTSTTIQADVGARGAFSLDVPFSVASDQPGRIAVYDVSARDGGIVHLASAEVTLLASGSASIQPAPASAETITISEPTLLANVAGGLLRVSGFSEYFFEANLGVIVCGEGGSGAAHQLCGTDDNVLTVGSTTILSPEMGIPGPFNGEFIYILLAPVSARIVVFAASPRDGGLLHATSVMVMLAP